MPTAPLLSLIAALSAVPQADGWTALPLPSLCRETPQALRHVRLESGNHLVLGGDEPELRPRSEAPAVPLSVLLGLLQDDAVARGLPLQFHPSAPPLLVRGRPGEVDAVRALVRELDRAGRDLDVELRVWLPEGVADGTDRAAFERQVGNSPPWATARARSGLWTDLGQRRSRTFLTGYEVEVATDAGVADPTVSRAVLGDTLHLRACRARAGTAVHIEGLLDLAELAEVARFDAETPDLGIIEQPALDVVQIAFAGVVDSGGLLQLSLQGTALERADRTLWIEARTRPDPVPEGADAAAAWRGVDLALLGTRVVDLPMPSPGAGLEDITWIEEDVGVLSESFPASAVALLGDAPRSGRGRTSCVWSEGYLLVPPGDGEVWSEIQGVVRAVEGDRLRTARLDVVRGPLRISLPVAEGYPARVLIGREYTRLVDFDVYVAQESWMPWPRVEPLFDGLLLQGRLRDGALVGAGWVAATPEVRELTREDVPVGGMQLIERVFEGRRLMVPATEPRVVLGTGAAALEVQLHAR